MVRLRTDRWYSGAGQQRSRVRVGQQIGGARRLLSLCFLLALVVLLMQKAADPRHISNAFQALGVPLNATPGTRAAAPTTATPVPHSTAAASNWQITCRDLIPRLLDQLPDNQLVELARVWFAAGPAGAAGAAAVWPQQEESLAILKSLADSTRQSTASESEQSAWLERLERFRAQWQQLGEHPQRNQLSPEISAELQSAITAYLDQRLVNLLRDASPWTAAETFSFWRLLQRSEGAAEAAVPAPTNQPLAIVSTLQLTAEADTLRGSQVRFRGSVRRTEFVQRSYPGLGFDRGYWMLWLRGQDNAVQPVAVYTTDPRAEAIARQVDADTLNFPEIEVTAIPAKRLAYASQSGVQVAPTLFASSLAALNEKQSPLAKASGDELWSRFIIAVVAACLLAAAVIVPIAWQRRGQSAGTRHGPATRDSVGQLPASDISRKAPHKSGYIAAPLLILAASLSAAGWLAASRLALLQTSTPPQPPWAQRQQADPLQPVFIDSLHQLYDTTNLKELRRYQAQREGSLPDSLLKAVHAARRITWPRALSLPEPISLSDDVQLRCRNLSGWVRLAAPVFLNDAQQSWFQADDQEQLYRVELQLESGLFQAVLAEPAAAAGKAITGNSSADEPTPQFVTVYCQQVPAAWLVSPQLRQPSQFSVLAFEDVNRGDAPWCALAFAPQWRLPPAMTNAELANQLVPALTQQQLELGRLGWDLMHLDTVLAYHQQPLSSQEAEGFYSLIRLVGAADRPATFSASTVSPSPLKTLADPRQSLGKEVNWLVRLVSGTLVAVDDPHHRNLLGAEAYIQYDGFVDIGRDRVRFKPATAGQQPAPRLEFEGEFPITIVSSLDNGLFPQNSLERGARNWEIGQYARLQGRFYRLWAYQSDAVKSGGQAARQIAPLVIADRLLPGARPLPDQQSSTGWFGWALCAATVVILGGILWSTAAGLRPRKRVAS